MMRRRMAQMNARMNPGGMGAAMSAPSGAKGVPGGAPLPHPIQPQASLPNHANAAGKPGSSAHPNQNVLEAVKKVRWGKETLGRLIMMLLLFCC